MDRADHRQDLKLGQCCLLLLHERPVHVQLFAEQLLQMWSATVQAVVEPGDRCQRFLDEAPGNVRVDSQERSKMPGCGCTAVGLCCWPEAQSSLAERAAEAASTLPMELP